MKRGTLTSEQSPDCNEPIHDNSIPIYDQRRWFVTPHELERQVMTTWPFGNRKAEAERQANIALRRQEFERRYAEDFEGLTPDRQNLLRSENAPPGWNVLLMNDCNQTAEELQEELNYPDIVQIFPGDESDRLNNSQATAVVYRPI
jgi:hypothetical protein